MSQWSSPGIASRFPNASVRLLPASCSVSLKKSWQLAARSAGARKGIWRGFGRSSTKLETNRNKPGGNIRKRPAPVPVQWLQMFQSIPDLRSDRHCGQFCGASGNDRQTIPRAKFAGIPKWPASCKLDFRELSLGQPGKLRTMQQVLVTRVCGSDA